MKLDGRSYGAIRIVDKAHYRDHTNSIFIKYKCLKLNELINSNMYII